MSVTGAIGPHILPVVRSVNRTQEDLIADFFARGGVDLVASASAGSSGQIYHPLTGRKMAAGAIPSEVLPLAGAPGGGAGCVAAFGGWDELVPPDPDDWDSNGGNEVVTDLGDGAFNVLLENGSGTYLRHACTVGAADHTLAFEWRKTPGTTETGTATFVSYDAVGSAGSTNYLVNATPPEKWTRVTVTETDAGTGDSFQIFDSGGAEFQIRQLSFRQTAYALPYTGLAAGATRAATDAQASSAAISGAAGSVIVAAVPYGEDGASVADRVLFASTDGKHKIFLDQSDSGKMSFSIEDDAGAADTYAGDAPSKDELLVVGMTWTGSGVTYYVDGVAVGTDTAGSGTWADMAANPHIGHTGGTLDFNGLVAAFASAQALPAEYHKAFYDEMNFRLNEFKVKA